MGRCTENQPSDDVRTHETFVVPKLNAGLIWVLTADVEQEENDDESLHD